METVVYDALTQKASVRFSTVEKPPVDESRSRMSTVVLVRKRREAPRRREPGSRLYVGDTLLYPNLGQPLTKGADKELGFYFAAYLGSDTTAPSANLELLQNAQPLARVNLELAPPDSERRIQQVSRIPTNQLNAGTYELRVTIRQGANTVSQSVPFRVAD